MENKIGEEGKLFRMPLLQWETFCLLGNCNSFYRHI